MALRMEHANLNALIDEALQSAPMDQLVLQRLKKRRLALKDQIDWGGVVATYIGLPVFLVIWWGYRMAKGSRTVAYGDMRFDGYVTIKK